MRALISVLASMFFALFPVLAFASGPTLSVDDPQACVACHGQVVSEWQESMHSRAHADSDPVFAAMRTLRMQKQGDAVAEKCAACHTPRSPTDTQSPAAKVGVSCAACHTVTEVDPSQPARGAARLTYGDGSVFFGPHDLTEGASAVHGTSAAPPHMTDGTTLCLACHGERSNPKGAITCTTGSELPHSSDPTATCTSCHMPQVEGPTGGVTEAGATHASHAFLGPHRAWLQGDSAFLAQAVDLKASIEDSDLVVVLGNLSGHAFPTGFPGRMAVVVAKGVDAAGEPLWAVPGKDAMKQHPEAVLNKVYVDDAGSPVLPPFAAKLVRDNRLKPDEVRTLRFSLPREVTQVEVKLVYHLMPPPAVEVLGLQGTPEATPKVMRSITVTR